MTDRAVVTISIDGKDVSSTWRKRLTSLTINLTDGGKSDTLEAEFDDADGVIILPAEKAKITASIERPGRGVVRFEGEVDEPESSGARGGGMTLSISAKSASPTGKQKQKVTKHKDNSTFQDAAKEFAKTSGLTVKIDSTLGAVQRPYWSIDNESFAAWAANIAEEVGATFKIMGQNAVFVPRNSGTSASGKALSTVYATRPGNIISWQIKPTNGRAAYKTSRQRWYDPKEAKWKVQTVQLLPDASDAVLTDTGTAASESRAKSKAKANADEAKRARGGGSISLDGDGAAQPQAPIVISGTRPGVDGQYQIKSASHTYTRGGGWVATLQVEHPQGAAGKDTRKKK